MSRPDLDAAQRLRDWIGQQVVIDLQSPYVCMGTLQDLDDHYLEVIDADLHDFRDSRATREIYVYDSARLGIRRNRAKVLIRQSEVVAIARIADILEE